MKYTCLSIVTLLFSLLLLSACRGEEPAEQPSGGVGNGVFLSLYLPGKAGTRTVDDNGTIENIYAIYFQKASDNSMKCTGYEELGSLIEENDSDGKKILNYRLTNYPVESNVDIVFIANLDNYITPQDTWIGKTDDELMKDEWFLTRKPTAQGEGAVWPSDSPNEYIPMYTRARNLTFPKSLSDGTYYVKDNSDPVATRTTIYQLIRMLARVEIENHTAGLTNGNLTLDIKTIEVENGHLKGYICNNLTDGTETRVSAPTFFDTNMDVVGTGTSVGYAPTTNNNKQTLVFYLFETGVEEDVVKSDKNCRILLHGVKEGSGSTDDNLLMSSFMLPFPTVTVDGTGAVTGISMTKPGPVLRNHNYKYLIEGVADVLKVTVVVEVLDWVPATDLVVDLTEGEI